MPRHSLMRACAVHVSPALRLQTSWNVRKTRLLARLCSWFERRGSQVPPQLHWSWATISFFASQEHYNPKEGVAAAKVVLQYLETIRMDEVFEQFYGKAVEKSKDLIAPPKPPQNQESSRRNQEIKLPIAMNLLTQLAISESSILRLWIC